jgi:hypothetical protein
MFVTPGHTTGTCHSCLVRRLTPRQPSISNHTNLESASAITNTISNRTPFPKAQLQSPIAIPESPERDMAIIHHSIHFLPDLGDCDRANKSSCGLCVQYAITYQYQVQARVPLEPKVRLCLLFCVYNLCSMFTSKTLSIWKDQSSAFNQSLWALGGSRAEAGKRTENKQKD